MNKYLLPVIVLLLVSCLFTGCEEEEATLAVSDISADVGSKGGIQRFTLHANSEWTAQVVNGNEWLQIIPASGRGTTIITITIEPNHDTLKNRLGAIRIKSGSREQHVVIRQRNTTSGITRYKSDTCCIASTATLSAYTDSNHTVDWYESATGGNPLLAGSTTYTTPVLITTTIYYAEMRHLLNGNVSNTRTPITAVVLPPLIGGAIDSTFQMTIIGFLHSAISNSRDASGGNGKISYQWYKNKTPISNAISANYISTVIDVTTAGTFIYARGAFDTKCNTSTPVMTEASTTVCVVDCSLYPSTQTGTFAAFTPNAGAPAGDKWTLTDERDNKQYNVVKMPDGRYWMVQNLDYRKDMTFFAKADEPVTAGGQVGGTAAIGGYWCPGDTLATSSSQAACATYGALYTWETTMMLDGRCSDESRLMCGPAAWNEMVINNNYYSIAPAASDSAVINNGRGASKRGICPSGWHVPTDHEWAYLMDKCEGNGTGNTFMQQTETEVGLAGINDETGAGARLKSVCACTQNTCASDNTPAWYYLIPFTLHQTDTYGFRVVPAGYRELYGTAFLERGKAATFWTSSVNNGSNAWTRYFRHKTSQSYRKFVSRSYGSAVRCIKD